MDLDRFSLAKGRMSAKTAEQDKIYLDKIKEKETKLIEKFGTASVIDYINHVLSTQEGFNHFLALCGDNRRLLEELQDASLEFDEI